MLGECMIKTWMTIMEVKNLSSAKYQSRYMYMYATYIGFYVVTLTLSLSAVVCVRIQSTVHS